MTETRDVDSRKVRACADELPPSDARHALNQCADAVDMLHDRLAEIERQLRELADQWDQENHAVAGPAAAMKLRALIYAPDAGTNDRRDR